MGWRVISIDGHDHSALNKALTDARREASRPTLIIGTTRMGKDLATMEGDHETHGTPIPLEERKRTKAAWGFPADADFYAPEDFYARFRQRHPALAARVNAWKELVASKKQNPDFARRWAEHFERANFQDLPRVPWAAGKDLPTRNAFGDILAHWADALPALMGGSADLEPSVMTGKFAAKVKDFTADHRLGRNIAFGVKEFPMAAIANGMALHGGVVPFTATFLTFSDYSRPALRLGAIQESRVIHEFTHDSFYLGEDGPTHQPVEHLMALRQIPHLYVIRPADARETEVLLRHAFSLKTPSVFALSRQKLPLLSVDEPTMQSAARGAYVVHDCQGFDTILIATGSEVALALSVAAKLADKRLRVVSMPCWELFAEQPKSYQESVLPSSCRRRVSIEAGTTLGWERYVMGGLMIGRDTYGHSAPAEVLAAEYGFTVEAIAKRVASAVW
jgi:transketolase